MSTRYQLDSFLGASAEIAAIRKQLPQIAKSRIPVLVYGETGTGKTMLAEIIHSLSQRSQAPYVHLDCGGMVEDLVSNELFGHMRGSYTSADRTQVGLIEQAHGGTLFLDELGNLSYEAQTKLLQVLDEGRFRRVGGVEEIQADVRVIGASSRPLRQYVSEGKFRKDLYYRMKGVRVYLQPLRQRREDILLLFNHYLSQFCHRLGRKVPRLTHQAREVLLNYSWPGNVRELMRLAEEIACLHQVEHVTPTDLLHLELEPIRCREVKHCDREDCPAYENEDHRCWLVDHTLCYDGLPRKVGEKIPLCVYCEVFLKNCFVLGESRDTDLANFLFEQIQAWSRLSDGRIRESYGFRMDRISFKELRERVLDRSSREYFVSLLKKYNGDLDRVSRQSGLSKSSVYQILRRHNLTVEEFRSELDFPVS